LIRFCPVGKLTGMQGEICAMERRTLASLEAEFQQWLAQILESERQRLAAEIAQHNRKAERQDKFSIDDAIPNDAGN
jgi:hypothetical protein